MSIVVAKLIFLAFLFSPEKNQQTIIPTKTIVIAIYSVKN